MYTHIYIYMLWNAVRTLDGMMCILQLFESLSFFPTLQ